jgi:hypothetical protein
MTACGLGTREAEAVSWQTWGFSMLLSPIQELLSPVCRFELLKMREESMSANLAMTSFLTSLFVAGLGSLVLATARRFP